MNKKLIYIIGYIIAVIAMIPNILFLLRVKAKIEFFEMFPSFGNFRLFWSAPTLFLLGLFFLFAGNARKHYIIGVLLILSAIAWVWFTIWSIGNK